MNKELNRMNRWLWTVVIILAVTLVFVLATKACAAEVTSEELVQYITDCGYSDDGFVDAVLNVAYEEYGQDPWVWTMVAFFESRWQSNARGKAGERGWVQVHPCHMKRFTDNGLDWNDPADQLRVACMMVQDRLDEDKSLRIAFSPWATRTAAWSRYKKVLNEEPGYYNKEEE